MYLNCHNFPCIKKRAFEQGKSVWEIINEEKVDNANKAKFKVGDWVMLDRPVLITKVEDMPYNTHQYWTSDGTWFGDDTKAKLWNIEDAKDGDVLALSYESQNYILIYKGLHQKNFGIMMSVFCSYYVEKDTYDDETDSFHMLNTGEIITPATKEQHETLMKAMADAGWEFDFDKKELKKIDNGIEIPLGAKDSELQEAIYYIPKGFHAEIDADKVVIKKGEKPAAWSEDDEEMLEDVRNNFEYNKGEMTDSLIEQYDKSFDKIKFLKPQPNQEWGEEDESILQGIWGNFG